MYINDQRKPHCCTFEKLEKGDLFAWEEGEDLYYLMVVENGDNDELRAVVLGSRDGYDHLVGIIWHFSEEDEVQPLKGDLKVWEK